MRMAINQKEVDERQKIMFGCTEDELALAILENPTFKRNGASFLAFSMLSDIQEMISSSGNEQARQAINRVKFIIDEYLEDAK